MRALLLYARVALRNVRRNRRRSLFTVIAISFGLFCLIVFQALKVGLHREMTDGTVLLETGSLQVHAAGFETNLAALRPVVEPAKVERALRAEGVTAFSRRLRAPALLLSGGGSSTVNLTGVDPVAEPRVTRIAEKLVKGSYLGDDDRILIGDDLAKSLGVGPGGALTLLAQDPSGFPVSRRFTVGGVYRTELASFNRSRVFLPLAAAQRFLHADGVVTEIAALGSGDEEERLAARLRETLPSAAYQVRSWREIAPDLSQLIEMNDATMRLLILIVFAIVALGITNTMTMTVFERFRELGVLTAIGTPPSGILAMVALESLFIGAVAALLGSLAGIGACAWLARHGIDMAHFTSSNQYFAMTHIIRASLLPGDLLAANGVALATAFLAGLYPACKAARLEPVKAIGHV
jgi:ABC-type lipoprotein release transport system permease subunit